jgi:hypothetical protein
MRGGVGDWSTSKVVLKRFEKIFSGIFLLLALRVLFGGEVVGA